MTPVIAPFSLGDKQDFLAMWDEFVATDPNEPGDRGMGAQNWDRMNTGANLAEIIARNADKVALGFTLYSVLPFTWSNGPIAYLQDLHVRPGARGQRIGQRLIEHLAGIGEAEGWYKIFWMTQPNNVSAQKLYDRIGLRRDYIRYDLQLPRAGGSVP